MNAPIDRAVILVAFYVLSRHRSELGTFPTTTRPSVLKLWKDEAVVCGHFDGMASSFDLRQPPTNLKFFRAHAASILSIDLNTVS